MAAGLIPSRTAADRFMISLPNTHERMPAHGGWTPFRQMMVRKAKNLHISREIRPPPPTVLIGGGGWYCEIMLDVRAFLAFRQWPGLAEGPSNHPCIVRADIVTRP